MNYHQFICAVEERIQREVKESVTISVHTAEKNNGTIRKGITLTESGINISPTIYLEEYYQKYCHGRTIDYIVGDILELYEDVRFQKSWGENKIGIYEEIADKIVYRLINRKSNEKMLKDIPYVPYLDLAIVFYVLLEVTQYGTATMTINKEHLKLWGISEEEIFEQAKNNTCHLLPDEFQTMNAVIEHPYDCPAEEDIMYVLSNRIRSYGAAAILYPGRLEGIGAYLRENYYVLPSSIHEVIVVGEKNACDWAALSKMVAEINRTQVEPEEVLSDRAYYYDRKKRSLCM